MRRFLPTTTRTIATWECAVPSEPISRTIRIFCGAFKVPTLRNVATRQVFFHNGQFKTLRDALRFYVRRDTNPAEFYPVDADGVAQKFNDLPAELGGNVNTVEVPYDRLLGQAPRLADAELDDLEAFLNTLTDGYQPAVAATR